MEFQDVIRKRKMVRSFEDRPVDHAIVERMLANAQRAPSAGFSQGWGFLMLEGKDEAARYWDALWPLDRRAAFGWPDMFNAPVIIVCQMRCGSRLVPASSSSERGSASAKRGRNRSRSSPLAA